MKRIAGWIFDALLCLWAVVPHALDWVGRGLAVRDGPEFLEKLAMWLVGTPSWVPGVLATVVTVWLLWPHRRAMSSAPGPGGERAGSRDSRPPAGPPAPPSVEPPPAPPPPAPASQPPAPPAREGQFLLHDAERIRAGDIAAQSMDLRRVKDGVFIGLNIGPGARPGKDIPLRDVYALAFQRVPQFPLDAAQLVRFSELIAQDALNRTLRMKGRNPNGSLGSIDHKHWAQAIPKWSMCFIFTNTGQVLGMSNSNADSYFPSDPQREGVSDLHLNETQAREFLQRHGFL